MWSKSTALDNNQTMQLGKVALLVVIIITNILVVISEIKTL